MLWNYIQMEEQPKWNRQNGVCVYFMSILALRAKVVYALHTHILHQSIMQMVSLNEKKEETQMKFICIRIAYHNQIPFTLHTMSH